MARHPDTPRVIAMPPLIFMQGLLVALLLQLLWPTSFISNNYALPIGVLLCVNAIVLAYSAIQTFRTAGTNVDVRKPSTVLVTTGPYRYTRNPIYLAMTLGMLAIGIWVNTSWIFLGLAGALIIMHYGVIRREERYLAKKFGTRYEQYRQEVRRWL